jgi:RecB family endonuclease NucS
VCPFHEYILQALVKDYLKNDKHLGEVLRTIGISDKTPRSFEVLGEKALPQGHVDILVKEANPSGTLCKFIIEIKSNTATKKDILQLDKYVVEIGAECVGSILVAKDFSSKILTIAKDKKITLFKYSLPELHKHTMTYIELINNFSLEKA